MFSSSADCGYSGLPHTNFSAFWLIVVQPSMNQEIHQLMHEYEYITETPAGEWHFFHCNAVPDNILLRIGKL